LLPFGEFFAQIGLAGMNQWPVAGKFRRNNYSSLYRILLKG
jgi:hypothetical protein